MRITVSPWFSIKKSRSALWLIVWVAYLLFFMMLFVPTTYQLIKATLLLLILSAITIQQLLKGSVNLHPKILFWTLFMMIMGLFFMLYGVIQGAPGAFRLSTVYVLWPFVYTLFVVGAANEKILIGLLRLLVLTTIAIGIYGLSYILYAAGWLPDALYIPIEQGQKIGFYEGYIEYDLYSMVSLIFLVPFLVGCLLVWPKNMMMPVTRIWLWIALGFGLLLVLLSGRRGLLLAVAISPLVTLMLQRSMPVSYRFTPRKLLLQFMFVFGILVFFVIVINLVYDFDLQVVINEFIEGFHFDDIYNVSATVRRVQFFALLSEWADSPLLGAGLGASAKGYVKASGDVAWAFELSYVALLFHVGIVGFLCYTAAVTWVYWMGLRIIRSGDQLGLYLLPVLVGTSCFLIANATNPYLAKFDYIWVIFLPIAFINYWLLKNRRRSRQPLSQGAC